MKPTAWQDAEVAREFLEERRGGIPYGADQMRMLLDVAGHFCPQPQRIVDLGCGDGFLARLLLDRYPEARALLLDHSEPMLQRAHAAMAAYAGRCEIRLADLRDPLLPHVPEGSADLVVSGYAIHHLPHERKRSLYEEVFQVLAPGGLFVNVEHVASPTRRIEELFEQRYVDHLAAHRGKPRPQVEREYLERADKADNILESLETQLDWLREIGFSQVDCFFKWLELAVFGGVKTGVSGP